MTKEKHEESLYDKIKDKAIIGAIWFMLSTGAVFLYNRGMILWDMPDTVKRLENLYRIDSAEHSNERIQRAKDEHTQDSITKLHRRWLDDDYLTLDSIRKGTLKVKTR